METEFETNVRGIASYLGCNESELWSEIKKLFDEMERQKQITIVNLR